jgi:PAS domain S-box-containing protein
MAGSNQFLDHYGGSMFWGLPFPGLLLDAHGEIVAANERARQIREFENDNPDLIALLSPDGAARFQETLARVLDGGGDAEVDLAPGRTDAPRLQLSRLDSSRPGDPPLALAALHFDDCIGDSRSILLEAPNESPPFRRELDREILAATLEHMDQGVLVVDADNRAVLHNTRLCDLFDVDPGSLQDCPDFDDFATGWMQRRGATEEDVRGALENARSRTPFSREIPAAGGRILEMRHSPLEQGGFVRTFTDVTGQAMAKRILQRSHQELEQAVLERTRELQAKEALYRSMFHTNQAVKLIVDVETGDVEEANEAAAQFYGYSRGELLQLKMWDLNILSEARVREVMALAAYEPAGLFHFRHRLKSGEVRDVEVHSGPLYDPSGRPLLFSIIHDVTDRRRARRALRESEARFRLLVENAQEVFWIREVGEPLPMYVSPGLERICGISAGEMQQDPAAALAVVLPEDRPKALRGAVREIRRGEEYDHVIRIMHRRGGLRWIRMRTSLVPNVSEGRPRVIGFAEDVTDRKRSEARLQRSEERFRTIFERAEMAVCFFDLDQQLVMTNPAFHRFLKDEANSIADASIQDLSHPEDFDRERQYLDMLQNGDIKAYSMEKRFWDVNGETAWGRATATIVRDEHGRRDSILMLVADIAERKLYEHELAETEMRYRALFEHSQDGVSAYERFPDGRLKLLECNDSFTAMAGRSSEELLAAADVNAYRSPDVPEADDQEFAELLEQGLPVQGEYSWSRPDGAYNVIEYKAVPVRLGGRTLIYGVERDMTEMKRAEQALRESEHNQKALLNATSQMVLLYERDGTILAANEPAARFLGGGEPEQIIGEKMGDLFPASMEPQRRKRIREVIRSKRSQTFRETHPEDRLVEVTLYPVLDQEGEVRRLAVYASDVTEQVELERQLQQAQKLEALGALAGGVAHDFNNVLGIIVANAELLKDRLEQQPVLLRKAERLLEASLRARGVVRQILAFSRREEIRPQRIDLAQTLRESRNLLRNALPSSIRISLEAPHAPVPVMADPNQVNQILLNLASNARDAMAPHGGRLSITLEQVFLDFPDLTAAWRELAPGAYARLTVRDTGEGASQGVLERCIEPFFTTKPAGQGTGLGLSVVHGIVVKSGGALDIHSTPGQGTSVVIQLPLARKEPEVPAAAAVHPQGGASILLVEDEENLRRALSRSLRNEGFQVAEAGGGESALGRIEQAGDLDLLITDQTMPRMSGVELARRAWIARPGLPVLLCTGHLDVGADALNGPGPARFLLKPFTRQELLDAIHELLTPAHPNGGPA